MADDEVEPAAVDVVPMCPKCGEPLHRAGPDEHPVWECPDDGYLRVAE